MARKIGRRAWFFFAVSVLSLLMVWPCPPEFRWVAWFCGALALFWALMFAADSLSAGASGHHGDSAGGPRGHVG
jgi:hypothetical protein